MLKRQGGFTLIEIIVVIACIALLAAIIAPLAFNAIEDSKISRAKADVKAISAGIAQFNRDTGMWPTMNQARSENTIALLRSSLDGTPTGFDSTGVFGSLPSPIEPLDYHLMINESDRYTAWDPAIRNGWHGAYLDNVKLDPWGHSYIVTVIGFYNFQVSGSTNWDMVWVVSLGPNGVLDTDLSGSANGDTTLQGDDIGNRMQ